MPRVRDIGNLSEKWSRRASQASQDYAYGIQNPTVDWQQATLAAEEAWSRGVQEAIAERRFAGGVRQAGTEKWQRNALEKGPQRFSQGVQLAKNEWAQKWEPYRQVIEATTLPPRGPKGDPGNIERVRVMASSLHEAKRRRLGAGR